MERHRQLMDGFMSEQEAEAEKIKEQHQQDLNKLQSSFTVKYVTIIADLHGMIKEQRQELSVSDDECQEVSSEKELTKSKEEEKETNVKDDEYAESEDRDDLIASELHSLRLDLTELCQLVVRLKTKQQKAVDELRLQYEARLSGVYTKNFFVLVQRKFKKELIGWVVINACYVLMVVLKERLVKKIGLKKGHIMIIIRENL